MKTGASVLSASREFFFHSGKTIGAILLAMAMVGGIYLRFLAPTPSSRDAWPTEGYYFAGAQYQIALQSLRLTLAQVHNGMDTTELEKRKNNALVLRDVLHAKYLILTESPEMLPYLSRVRGLEEALQPLSRLHVDLDRLVDDAVSSPAGLQRFEVTVSPMYQRVLSMVNDLRVAELSAFEAAFYAQTRSAKIYQELGLTLLGFLGIGVYFHAKVTRKERNALAKEAEARAEAQRSAQARTALLGMVSHELRTPLQTMLANIELLSMQPLGDDSRTAIDSLERGIELISGQLDNIAQYTRLASGTFELRREPFVVADLLRCIASEHTATARENGQVLTLQGSADSNASVLGDPIRLHQVVTNFVSNAVKYSGPGTITISTRSIRHRFEEVVDAEAIEVRVEDNGPGIPVAEQATIWEPFVRGKRGPGRQKGSGLGLAVAKLLATSAGWEVGVYSSSQEGTAFYVRLPLSGPSIGAG